MDDPSSLKAKDYFETDFFSIGGSEGFLISFDLKLTLATSACSIMTLITKSS